jgi:flagellar M-ring protein FliF
MAMMDFWTALSQRQRAGFAGGLAAIVVLTAAIAFWALRDPWVTVARDLPADRLVTLTREMARDKLEHRVGDDGNSVEVRQSAVGRARVAAATGGVGLPPNVGLEIFKETDFSTTDFAQRINYQRALQGELTRTLQTIAGVRQARVHIVLPEGGVLKRGVTKASAAVTLTLAPGKTLSRAQVRGVQRLVASSVPDIKVDDVVVLDEAGTSLVRDGQSAESDLSGSQLEMKRQVDGYLEAKVGRLLEEIAPGVQVSLSVDTVLDYKQLKVTVEEPVSAAGAKDSERSTGVIARERQVQRSTPGKPVGGEATTVVETTDTDVEYKVGHRIEQSLQAPGTIKRISVAVAVQGAPVDLASDNIERLVAHAVGVDRQRGDSVMVLLLGRGQATPAVHALAGPRPGAETPVAASTNAPVLAGLSPLPLLALLIGASVLVWWRLRQRPAQRRASEQQVDDVARQVRGWLSETSDHGNR